MIKFLFSAAVVLICLFVIVLLLVGMTWIVAKLLRLLFPQRFAVVPAAKREKDVQ